MQSACEFSIIQTSIWCLKSTQRSWDSMDSSCKPWELFYIAGGKGENSRSKLKFVSRPSTFFFSPTITHTWPPSFWPQPSLCNHQPLAIHQSYHCWCWSRLKFAISLAYFATFSPSSLAYSLYCLLVNFLSYCLGLSFSSVPYLFSSFSFISYFHITLSLYTASLFTLTQPLVMLF